MTDDTAFHTLMIHGHDIEKVKYDISILRAAVNDIQLCTLFTSYEKLDSLIRGFLEKIANLEGKVSLALHETKMANNNVTGLGQQLISGLKNNVCPYHSDLDNIVKFCSEKANEIKDYMSNHPNPYDFNSLKEDLRKLIDPCNEENEEDDR